MLVDPARAAALRPVYIAARLSARCLPPTPSVSAIAIFSLFLVLFFFFYFRLLLIIDWLVQSTLLCHPSKLKTIQIHLSARQGNLC